MVTVVNLKADQRASILGQKFGEAFSLMVQQRLEERKEQKKKDALKEALTIFSQGSQKGTVTEEVPEQERRSEALKRGGGPTNKAAAIQETLPTQREREVSGEDISSILVDAGIDEKFAFTLSASLDEAKAAKKKEERQNAAMETALALASKKGATRQDIIASIASSDVDSDTKIKLLTNIDKFLTPDEEHDKETIKLFTPQGETVSVKVPQDISGNLAKRQEFVRRNFPGFSAVPVPKPSETAEKDFVIELFRPDGQKVKVPVPKDISRSQAARDAYAQRYFPGYSAIPIAEPDDADGLSSKAETVQMLTDLGYDEDTATKIATRAFRVSGPDPEGRIAITDLTTSQTMFKGGGDLTPSSLRILEQRLSSISDALYILKRADTSKAGITNILAGEVGGVAVQVPVLRTIASAMGLSDEQVAEIQVGRAGFFAALTPIAQSFVAGGSRSGVATKAQIDLAERILNMTRWASNAASAELARTQLIDILEDIQTRLTAQRISRSAIPPDVVSPTYEVIDGKLKITIPGQD